MPTRIDYHKDFKKSLKKLTKSAQNKLDDRLRILVDNQSDAQLKNHALTGRWKGYRSINITGDIRAVFKVAENGSILFTNIGTHSELYK
jgi:mRNA interferase YafQ